jgi:hypothetical protein
MEIFPMQPFKSEDDGERVPCLLDPSSHLADEGETFVSLGEAVLPVLLRCTGLALRMGAAPGREEEEKPGAA